LFKLPSRDTEINGSLTHVGQVICNLFVEYKYGFFSTPNEGAQAFPRHVGSLKDFKSQFLRFFVYRKPSVKKVVLQPNCSTLGLLSCSRGLLFRDAELTLAETPSDEDGGDGSYYRGGGAS
jgi:hypothetical protein